MTISTSSQIQVALFDVSGTLATRNIWAKLLLHPSIKVSQRYRFLAWVYPAWFANKLGLLTELAFLDGWIRGMANIFTNRPQDEVLDLFRWVINEHLLPNLHEDVVALTQEHKAQGHQVIFVSNMFAEAVQMLADELGADKGLGTHLEYVNAITTGDVISQPCAGTMKLQVAADYLREQGQSVDLKEVATAYSDSWSDRYMLNGVALPNATHPDKKLRKYATSQEWRIIDDNNLPKSPIG